MEHVKNLRYIFIKAVESVKPSHLFNGKDIFVREKTSNNDKIVAIKVEGKTTKIDNKRCHLVGFGKAVLGMAVQLERALDERLVSGILSIPSGAIQQFANDVDMHLSDNTRIKVFEGAPNNQPDDNALKAAHEIKELANCMTQDDILIVLISGGGSALLPMPKTPITLAQKMELIRGLSNRGASIQEMNVVRIALSDIKGGRLSAAARNAFAVISFVISDIVNDPLDLIASGPTCKTSFEEFTAVDVIQKYKMWDTLDSIVKEIIDNTMSNQPDFPIENNFIHIIGNNRVAAKASVAQGDAFGYTSVVVSTSIQGEVQEVAEMYSRLAENLRMYKSGDITEKEIRNNFLFIDRTFEDLSKAVQSSQIENKPLLLVMAGEPTVKVTGNGLGGRNQELALRMSIEYHRKSLLNDICFLSGGTDGIDGPTLAAGAIGSRLALVECNEDSNKSLLIAEDYLRRNDSYSFYHQFGNGKFHVITGHTGTNVMDLHLLLLP